MSRPAPLFDANALRLHRTRARPDACFLQEAALDEVEDRLSMVNRPFTKIGVVSPYPDLWSTRFPMAEHIADDDVLAWSGEGYDLIVHGMALHWANDPVGQLIQCRRVLREDGLFLALCLGGQSLTELRAALSEAEISETDGLSPRISPMAEIRDLGALLQRAGFALPVADTLKLTAEYRGLMHLMRDLRHMGETNALASRLRRPTRRTVFDKAQEIYLAAYGQPDGRLPATFELITLTGWVPSATQQKPLRPGSAQQRLADALNTRETSLRD
ncbi:SAM-dependent methyltransferase [Thalassococcus sp. S3]|uniref:SAM-dependent methyltransferase n=1 Tax=Thalassococcus sp. S3 TaxID=2017482 RepID=UPI00102443F5|nr:SAM-dependent methyltransferase [Thalassococcus sp. S3]QBF34109.1 SAM-dependent methyltransferase [Thalassococcus sp. S3]